ncbi:hypothetical protein RUMGNA_00156 [Mediterraneibacter gnavus ATCC 29149]|uniref:Uncharacterized protein n=1 Tax=Mediterraneibacter gnavus (strain ATCC 29149 / DSM 114966 / JCM 6515 / VPI C7-9) TaxID=411470 RepID=A7AXZ1_MEDG7|nr:hypothetical protein RUMGNA_00156 [Mediterraneibacter gnavus ATCC 29149]
MTSTVSSTGIGWDKDREAKLSKQYKRESEKEMVLIPFFFGLPIFFYFVKSIII